jgi:hypothetical protein
VVERLFAVIGARGWLVKGEQTIDATAISGGSAAADPDQANPAGQCAVPWHAEAAKRFEIATGSSVLRTKQAVVNRD